MSTELAIANEQTRSAETLAGPRGIQVAQAVADEEGVCTRPLAMRRTDTTKGEGRVVEVACGATREAVYGPCARRNRALHTQQCREGWHRDDEPDDQAPEPDADQRSLMAYRADLITMGREAQQQENTAELDDVREALADVDAELKAAGVRGRLASLDEPSTRRSRSTMQNGHPLTSYRGCTTCTRWPTGANRGFAE